MEKDNTVSITSLVESENIDVRVGSGLLKINNNGLYQLSPQTTTLAKERGLKLNHSVPHFHRMPYKMVEIGFHFDILNQLRFKGITVVVIPVELVTEHEFKGKTYTFVDTRYKPRVYKDRAIVVNCKNDFKHYGNAQEWGIIEGLKLL